MSDNVTDDSANLQITSEIVTDAKSNVSGVSTTVTDDEERFSLSVSEHVTVDRLFWNM